LAHPSSCSLGLASPDGQRTRPPHRPLPLAGPRPAWPPGTVLGTTASARPAASGSTRTPSRPPIVGYRSARTCASRCCLPAAASPCASTTESRARTASSIFHEPRLARSASSVRARAASASSSSRHAARSVCGWRLWRHDRIEAAHADAAQTFPTQRRDADGSRQFDSSSLGWYKRSISLKVGAALRG